MPVLSSYRNQSTDFYMSATLALNGLMERNAVQNPTLKMFVETFRL